MTITQIYQFNLFKVGNAASCNTIVADLRQVEQQELYQLLQTCWKMQKLAGSKASQGLTRVSGQVLIQRSVYLTNICHANFFPRISQFLFKETSCAQWLVKLAVVLQTVAKNPFYAVKVLQILLRGNKTENTLIISVSGKTTLSSHCNFFSPQAQTFAISKQAGVIVTWYSVCECFPATLFCPFLLS